MRKLKIGLDIHGVIDREPQFFIAFAKLIRQFGGEVHIITGTPYSEAENLLLSYNNSIEWWDHFFSIDDYLFEKKTPFEIDKRGGRYYDEAQWNRAKGVYCAEKKIDLHIDDSEIYGEFFSTPYLCVKDKI